LRSRRPPSRRKLLAPRANEDPRKVNQSAYAELRTRLVGFCHYVFKGFESPLHIRKIAEALERVERGELKRLIISIPPRHGKSTLVAILFAAWFLGLHPDRKIITGTYGLDLAREHATNCRRLMQSDRFQRLFPGIEFARDTNAADHWKTTRGGGYKAVGIGGPLTGHGAHVLIVDDPHKGRAEADSQLHRDEAYNWFTSDALSRLEPKGDGAVILIHTRWHEDDLIGRVTTQNPDGWEQIVLPAISPSGEPLWWELATYERIRDEEAQAVDWAALWMCDPLASKGALFSREWFVIVDEAPDLERFVRYYDLAISKRKKADSTAYAKVGVDEDGSLWIVDVWKGKKTFPEIADLIVANAESDGPDTTVGLPTDLIGTALEQELSRNPAMLRVPVDQFNERLAGNKMARASVWATRARRGKLKMVRAPWNEAVIREALAFGPNSTEDDIIDAISGAVEVSSRHAGGRKKFERPPEAGSMEVIRQLAAFMSQTGGE